MYQCYSPHVICCAARLRQNVLFTANVLRSTRDLQPLRSRLYSPLYAAPTVVPYRACVPRRLTLRYLLFRVSFLSVATGDNALDYVIEGAKVSAVDFNSCQIALVELKVSVWSCWLAPIFDFFSGSFFLISPGSSCYDTAVVQVQELYSSSMIHS